LDPAGLGPKTLRKSWEAGESPRYPEWVLEVFLSQGHTQMNALSHYLGLPYTMADKEGLKEWVGRWEK